MKKLKDMINEDFALTPNTTISVNKYNGCYVIFFPWGDDYHNFSRHIHHLINKISFTQNKPGARTIIFILEYSELNDLFFDNNFIIKEEESCILLIPKDYDIKKLKDDWASRKISIDMLKEKFEDITYEFKNIS